MPTFDTPQPISVTVNLGFVVGNVRLVAGTRTDTTVDVRPVDPSSKADRKVAEQTRVEYADGKLLVRGPRLGTLFTRSGAVDLTIELPEGSHLDGETGMGEVRLEGRLGECRFKNGYGDIQLDRAGPVRLNSGSGAVIADHVEGGEVTAGNGSVRIRRIDGPATVKNSNGDSWIGEAGGDLRLRAANGSITVDRAHADVTARTANGGIHVSEVIRGTVVLETAAGVVGIGIRAGTAAWLDLDTTFGRVHNELASSPAPDTTDDTVRVRASTSVGDITVRRSVTSKT
ncbi:DUF4097 family beta strand repeat-containing protein [Polymorphospora sp. NPDC051019]|uniref:DUF4097 family beta strand repeat-containing protein n=1 Tax=Polymorphospora sp. NPDC051019 TaxID=3155725 RepID=UPI00341EEB91